MATELKSLKRERSEQEMEEGMPEREEFPTRMFLMDEEVQALGLEDAEVGDEKLLTARVKVQEVSARESEEDGKKRHVQLVLTEGAVEDEGNTESDTAERMFGEGE